MKFTRRKRKIISTSAFIIIVTTASLFFVWDFGTPVQDKQMNKPDGIISKLNRELPDDIPGIHFIEATEDAGIRFIHFNNARTSTIAEDMGSGTAWVDYDNDGYDDLFILNYSAPVKVSEKKLAQSKHTSKLYRNIGNGTFEDVTSESGLGLKVRGMATAWADYNNDGFIDCLITTFGSNKLFKNNGDGTFSEVTGESGIGGIEGFWAGAAWGDYNLDGFIDIYITGYVNYFDIPKTEEFKDLQEPPSINPSVFEPHRNLLYRNNGDNTFREVAGEAGVSNTAGRSLQAVWLDINNDMYPDLYVANDVSDNVLFKNMQDGTFMDISHSAKVADYRGSMGIAVGDWNGDADLDLFITHWIAEENALYDNLADIGNNQGMIFFRDEADRYGLGQASLSYVGWATFFLDIDNDGRLDLFTANGHTIQQAGQTELLVPMHDQLFWNRNNNEGFYDISEVAGKYFSKKYVGRGGALSDYNNDGRLDIFIMNHNGPAVLLQNQSVTGNNWLQVVLNGTEGNSSAIGAKLKLVTSESTQIREVGVQRSYLSHNSLVQHFGLKSGDQIDSLVVQWPGGLHQVFKEITLNQRIEITEGSKIIQNRITSK